MPAVVAVTGDLLGTTAVTIVSQAAGCRERAVAETLGGGCWPSVLSR